MRGVKTMAPPTTMNLLTLDESETAALVERLGWPAYRTGQILRWLYQRRARTISQMTDLSQADRATLEREARIGRSLGCTVFRSADGTRKLILKLEDELEVEAVLIPDDERLTLCVSTQVGCTLDCGFCLTGTMGLKRNLRAHEIIEQVLTAHDHLDPGERISNMVFMGMGEPLANLTALSEAVRRLTNPKWGLGWSPRRITVSTAGFASKLHQVAALGVNLAVSLNATTEEQRARLMPAVHAAFCLPPISIASPPTVDLRVRAAGGH
jgi:23S rRNA (adenine2503-C2)-methyltransferase